MHLVRFIIQIFHNARSPERKKKESYFLGHWFCKLHRTLPPGPHLQLRGWGIHPLGRQPVQETTCYETTTVQKPPPPELIQSYFQSHFNIH